MTDVLTGLWTVSHFRRVLEDILRSAEQQSMPLSAVMIDIDCLKAYNRTFGHTAGDDVLRSVADLLLSNAGADDISARSGGEEFIVVLPASDADTALLLAERIRRAVEVSTRSLQPVTVSLGVATLPPDCLDQPTLLADMSRALSHSKQRGGNRVTHADDLGILKESARLRDRAG